MANLSQANLRTEVRRLLNEPTANVFSDDEINDWIDIAARNISSVTGCIETQAEMTFTSGDAGRLKHDISSTAFIRVNSVTYLDLGTREGDVGLERITPEMLGNVCDGKTESRPQFYTVFGDDVYVWPTHSAGLGTAGDQLLVIGPTMVASLGTALPEYLQYPCVYFALACAYTKDGKYRKAAYEMQRYMSIIMRYRRDVVDDLDRVDGKESRKLPDRTVTVQQ